MLTRMTGVFAAGMCKHAREKIRCNYIDLPCEKEEDGVCEVEKWALYCPALGFKTGVHKRYYGTFVDLAEDWLADEKWEKEQECQS